MNKTSERRITRATFKFESNEAAEDIAHTMKFGTLPSDLYPIKLTVREYRTVEFSLKPILGTE